MQYSIEFFRAEYQKQQKLEQIVNSRILKRPKTKKWQVVASFIILPFLLFLLEFAVIASKMMLAIKIIFTILVFIATVEVYLRFCCSLVVRCYQHYAKEETRRRCKCIPSCSEYALLCFKRVFPLVVALIKIRKRLYVTCDGEDYVIDFPLKKMEKDFESTLQ